MCASSNSHRLVSAKQPYQKPSSLSTYRLRQFCYVRNIELTVKSSRACAPRLSFLASAECIVIHAFIKRFSNSIVSTKSEFLKCKVSKYRALVFSMETASYRHFFSLMRSLTISNSDLSLLHHQNCPMSYQSNHNL